MENENLIKIKEGLVEIYIYSTDKDSIPSKSMNVFYNKKMEINRDITNLSVLAYNELINQDGLVIVDSMAASGISSIRMLKECKNIEKLCINDINPIAIELIRKNLILNNLNGDSFPIEISKKDANYLFTKLAQLNYISSNSKQKRPNVISIDPFGTPNIYLDSAFKSIQKENGLMCITATDTAVLFGVRPDACFRKYMSKSIHSYYSKEIGARILIYFISRIANVNNLGILPLLTFYTNHFIRVFCLTFKNKKRISESFKNYGYVIYCKKCDFRSSFKNEPIQLPKQCPICRGIGKMDFTGPLWVDNLHDENFVAKLSELNEQFNYRNKKKIHKLLRLVKDEIDMPISYYNIHKLCQRLKLPYVPKIDEILRVIKEKGYKVSRTHFDFLSVKTNMDIKSLETCLLEIKN
ncbi:MAG: tRNA (guanine(10)-N(2))-dimethyltransferase [Candidatus Hermodarchaeota archaeon]